VVHGSQTRIRACALTLLLLAPAALRTSAGERNEIDPHVVAGVSALVNELRVSIPLSAPAVQQASFGSRAATQVSHTAAGYVRAGVGCMSDRSPATMAREFRYRIGPLIGWDNPHVIPLGSDRYLWLVHDSYMDYSFEATTLREVRPQIQNLAFIQSGSCFSLFHRGTLTRPTNFEPGRNADPPNSFFWPLGGMRDGARVKVFWARMAVSTTQPGPWEGIVRHPTGTWVGEYDARTLERLAFYRSPSNDAREPQGASRFKVQYGFAVESTRTYSYLFGNANMLNLAMSGGLDNSPHPATRMYLARVPRGRFDLAPEYRTATGWSRDSEQAVPISSRYSNENTMQPRRFGADKWIAVTKVNGFNGDGVVIDVATRPWGPWRTVQRLDFRTPYDSQITYHPVLMPWRTANGDLTMAIALNGGASWEVALDNPHLYRPGVAEVAWPAS